MKKTKTLGEKKTRSKKASGQAKEYKELEKLRLEAQEKFRKQRAKQAFKRTKSFYIEEFQK